MKSLNKPAIILFDLDYTLFDVDKFKQSNLTEFVVYDEVPEVLEKLSKKYLLGILSQGERELQKLKIKKTGLNRYFKDENTHIVKDKLASVAGVVSLYKKSDVFLVEDRLEVLVLAKKIFPMLFSAWIKRGRYALRQKEIPGFMPDAVVVNLREIVSIINS